MIRPSKVLKYAGTWNGTELTEGLGRPLIECPTKARQQRPSPELMQIQSNGRVHVSEPKNASEVHLMTSS